MSETERLRLMLNEHGIEWRTNKTLADCWTRWDHDKKSFSVLEINGIFAYTVGHTTAEQAFEAAFGRNVGGDR